MLVLVKGEVHIYPQHDGKFQEIYDPNESGLEFDVFINCWLVLAEELSLRIADLQLTLNGANGSTRDAERVRGDLKNWHIREGSRSEESSDWSDELDAAVPLDCGAVRAGW